MYFNRDEAKVPGSFLHLPSGEVRRIRRMQAEPPLVRFWGTDADADFVDVVLVILVAVESVAISIRTLEADEEVFEIVDRRALWMAEDAARESPDLASRARASARPPMRRAWLPKIRAHARDVAPARTLPGRENSLAACPLGASRGPCDAPGLTQNETSASRPANPGRAFSSGCRARTARRYVERGRYARH